MSTVPQYDAVKGAPQGGARLAGRVAQFLLGIPLGLVQLAAVLMFTFNGTVVTLQDWLVAAWGAAMSATCAVLALRVYRSARARRIAARAVQHLIDRFWAGSVEQFLVGMVDERIVSARELERLARKVKKSS